MKICFLENTKFEYSYKDKDSHLLRGAENSLINLSYELSKLGHDVFIFNNCNLDTHNDKSNWYNINLPNPLKNELFDVAIANGDTRLLYKIKSQKKIVFSYSLQSIEKFIRKGQLIPYLRHRPTYFLIGDYHSKKRSKFISLFGTKILKLSVDKIFHEVKIDKSLNQNLINNNLAIFTSRHDRNLDLLLNMWNKLIYPDFKQGKLLVTPSDNINEHNNIYFRKMGKRSDLIADLLKAKIFLIPGHKAELFCLAAQEARELCIPTVTLGIGSLYERVEHGITGFIANNEIEFASYSIELFKNDNLWNKLRNNLIKIRGKSTWSNCANDFINQVRSI